MAEGLLSNILQTGGTAMASAITYIQLHKGNPGTTGSNPCTSARKSVTCTSSGGVITVPKTDFDDLAANEDVLHVGLWSAVTGGTFCGYFTLTGDQKANANGEYTVNASTITGSSSGV